MLGEAMPLGVKAIGRRTSWGTIARWTGLAGTLKSWPTQVLEGHLRAKEVF